MTKNVIAWASLALFIGLESRAQEAQAPAVGTISPAALARGDAMFKAYLAHLQVLDIPEALGLLAPLPLRLVGARSETFSTTRAIYDGAGATASLRFE